MKSVRLGKIQSNARVNSDHVCACSTMVDVNTDNVGVHYSMVETKTRDGRKSARRCHAGSSETAHDVADVAAEDFDQLEGRGDRRDIAPRLQNADIGRRQTGALGQLLPCPAARLAELAKDRAETVGVRVVSPPDRHGWTVRQIS